MPCTIKTRATPAIATPAILLLNITVKPWRLGEWVGAIF